MMRAMGALGLALLSASTAMAQPVFESASPTAGTAAAERAGAMADKAAYRAVDYANASKRGPRVVVLPGEVKNANAGFAQRMLPNNIADLAELELTRANFGVLERASLGAAAREIELAYNAGDPVAAQKVLQKGALQSTRWIVKFDVLKAEPIGQADSGFDGRAVGGVLGTIWRNTGGQVAERVIGSTRTATDARVWLVGMRYKIIDANTTEQVATGYHEQKMEVGATATSVLGASSGASGGAGFDTLVQRLVQLSVYEIDSRHK
jgi:hypothetical protein